MDAWCGQVPEEVQERQICDLDFEQSKAMPGAHTNAKGSQIIRKNDKLCSVCLTAKTDKVHEK